MLVCMMNLVSLSMAHTYGIPFEKLWPCRYPDCQGIANWVAAEAGDVEAAALLRKSTTDSSFDEHMA